MLNKNTLYIIASVLFIISLMNLFLWTILFKSIKINLYDPQKDINQLAIPLTETLEKYADRNAQVNIDNNWNSWFDHKLTLDRNKKYNDFMDNVIKNWLPITECNNLEYWIDKDKCFKEYRNKLLLWLSSVVIDKYNEYDLVKNICQYWQNNQIDINNCIWNSFLKTKQFNIFECKDVFYDNIDLEKGCYEKNFDNLLSSANAENFLWMMVEISKALYHTDSKWRVISKVIDSKTLKENPIYKSNFAYIIPYFRWVDVLDKDYVKNNKILYLYLKEKIDYFNNPNNFDMYKYSLFRDKYPELFSNYKKNDK